MQHIEYGDVAFARTHWPVRTLELAHRHCIQRAHSLRVVIGSLLKRDSIRFYALAVLIHRLSSLLRAEEEEESFWGCACVCQSMARPDTRPVRRLE